MNELEQGSDEQNLKSLLRRAPRVPAGLRALIALSDDIWGQMENMARRREDLTYGRSVPVITDADLQEAEELVKSVLVRLYRIQLDS